MDSPARPTGDTSGQATPPTHSSSNMQPPSAAYQPRSQPAAPAPSPPSFPQSGPSQPHLHVNIPANGGTFSQHAGFGFTSSTIPEAGPSTAPSSGPKITLRAPSLAGSSGLPATSPGQRRSSRPKMPRSRAAPSRSGAQRSSNRTSDHGASKINRLTFKLKKSDDRLPSFLGEYDRELDENPDEPLAFEEQFILRVPKNVAGDLSEMVKKKGNGLDGVHFKFLDSRRAVFTMNGITYASKLVDLPNIIESQKTFDNRHLFKVADISQMLVVDHPIKDESTVTADPLKIDEYIWPHGITPPLRHVRKRRFRKRLSRRMIEVVEERVEELMKKDKEAEATSFDLIDAHPDPDISDSYYIDYDPEASWQREYSEFGESEAYEDPGSVAPSNPDEHWTDREGSFVTDTGESADFEGQGDGDGYDEELAAALMKQMEEGSDRSGGSDEGLSASEEEDDDDEVSKSEDEEDEEMAEKRAKIRQFTSEIKALETAIEKKRAGFQGGNPIIQRRFEETIAGLQGDIKTKTDARQVLVDEIDRVEAESKAEKEAANAKRHAEEVDTPGDDDIEMGDADADGEDETPLGGSGSVSVSGAQAGQERDAEGEDDDLFGDDDDQTGEEIGATPQTPADGTGDEEEDEEDEGSEDEEDDEAARPEGGNRRGSDDATIEALFSANANAGADAEGDGEVDDEMAAMLQAEMDKADGQTADQMLDAGLASNARVNIGGDVAIGEGEDADEALGNLAAFGGSGGTGWDGGGSSPVSLSGLQDLGYGAVEGGVGRRRLAAGHVEGDGDDDDDDTDSSED